MKITNEALTFDDIVLVPKYSEVESRDEVSTKTRIGQLSLEIPIISSPMDTITESAMAIALMKLGGVGIIHRYLDEITQLYELEAVIKTIAHETKGKVGIAVGVKDFLTRAKEAQRMGCDILCIDVAHGHHSLVERTLKSLRDAGITIHIMTGNIGTTEAYMDMTDWGADSVRVGLSFGSVCKTRDATGFAMPTLQAILNCKDYLRKGPSIIADGGIRTSGDIVKSLAAGADAVMLGYMLAGTDECPPRALVNSAGKYITGGFIRGMASADAQKMREKSIYIEGTTAEVRYNGTIKRVIPEQILPGVRSGISYTGCKTIKDMQQSVIATRKN